jgi:formylglycine-generating enzyme required for sulfatase activity
VDSVSWHQSREWLQRLNRWFKEQWPDLGGSGEAPQLALPSENQWEGACRAGAATPFHFGDTLDASWERYDASSTFGRGRKGAKTKQSGLNGISGLVNRWGLGELHGQLWEWCEDSVHPNPVGVGHPEDGEPWREEDADLVRRESGQRGWKRMRGGSWFNPPHSCRAAFRNCFPPAFSFTYVGFRPCFLLPPGSLLVLEPFCPLPWGCFLALAVWLSGCCWHGACGASMLCCRVALRLSHPHDGSVKMPP